ncbi:redoxin domain-containing protein [Pedobacter faecalis]|uniref:redoxin domain-containing protein n=1 Tax=Pedobacter faecalis TaxID=3041495 RepID=UPI00254E60A9|nr:redoxin domain-containing protein [Pedobacter sp. ELA7]
MNITKIGISLCALALPLFAAAQGRQYVVEGKIGKLNPPAKAYLFLANGIDSTVITKGSFKFTGNVDGAMPAHIIINKKGTGLQSNQIGGSPFTFNFYIEPGKISITSPDSLPNAKLTGGPLNMDYVRLKAQLRPTDKALGDLVDKLLNATPETRNSKAFNDNFQQESSAIGLRQKKIWLDFIKNNPNSLMSLMVLKSYSGVSSRLLYNSIPGSPALEEVDSLYHTLGEQVRLNPLGKDFGDVLARQKYMKIGAIAPDFSQTDANGKLVSLKDFKGKYLLIDFWASWCGPCRAENPTVVKAYHKYKAKGFDVLGVSLDFANGREAWLKAIEDDQLTWTQVTDLKGWQNKVADLYMVRAVPQNYLLDPDGRIIGINLRGEALENKLQEVLGAVSSVDLDADTFEYVVKGKLPKSSIPKRAFYVYTHVDGTIATDSTDVKDGVFSFKASTNKKESLGFVRVSDLVKGKSSTSGKFIQFYTDSTTITLTSAGTIDQAKIAGGELNRDEQALAELVKKEPEAGHLKFLQSHPNSLISINALQKLRESSPDIDVESHFNSLSARVRASEKGKAYAAKISEWKKVMIGAYAPQFTAADTAGKPVSLKEFKGKYVLLDFWASWCPPCREESPFLRAALNKYGKDNFIILGISLDNPRTGKEGWIKAIKDDKLTWPQVSDLKYENEVAKLYSVTSIPQNFLLDPDGRIIATNLRGEGVDRKLGELLKPL